MDKLEIIETIYMEAVEDGQYTIQKDMREEQPDVDDYEMPQAHIANELDGFLFDSTRDYFEQLKNYKEFQGR